MAVQYPWRTLITEPLTRDHLVQVYRDESVLVEAISLFAGAALGRHEAMVVIATADHGRRLKRSLETAGFEVDELEAWGQLTVLDAEEVLSRFMVDGMPDRTLFREAIGAVLARVRGSSLRFRAVRAYGEMVNLLWARNLRAAVRLEELWNELIEETGLSLFCAYQLGASGAPEVLPATLHSLHTHSVPVEACA